MKKYIYVAYDWHGNPVELTVIADSKGTAGILAQNILKSAPAYVNIDEGICLKREENLD